MFKPTPVGEPGGRGRGHLWLILSCWLTLTLILLISISAYSQVLYGSLTGNVTDSSGAAITDAKIVVLNVATGVSREVTTDSNGAYMLSAVQPGIYKITISAPKFASSVTEMLRLLSTIRNV